MQGSIGESSPTSGGAQLHVRKIGLSHPFRWLGSGARDMARLPAVSLGVGAAVTAIGLLLIVALWKVTYLVPAMLGGFLIVAPFIAMPLCALARQLEQGLPPDSSAAWRAWKGNASSIAQFGLMLALACVFWERLVAVVFAFHYGDQALRLSRLLIQLLSGQILAPAFSLLAAGAVLATAIFALGVVSAPLLMDRPVNVSTAVLTSLKCCARNPWPMLLWAVLIGMLTLTAFATLMLGMVIVFPWLAYASWHAYRDMVGS